MYVGNMGIYAVVTMRNHCLSPYGTLVTSQDAVEYYNYCFYILNTNQSL